MATRISAILALLGLSVPLWAQDPIRGPMLGWVWDSRQEAIRPVLGIAGSSVLGKAIDAGGPAKFAVISGAQEYAFALLGDNREPASVDLRAAEPVINRLSDIAAGAERGVLSPRGKSAVLWYAEAKKLNVIGGLRESVSLLRELDLSNEGAPSEIAVSDDGALVLASYPDTRTLLILDQDGNRWKLPKESVFHAAAFLEDSHDALLSAEDGVFLARDISANAELQAVWEGATAGSVAALDSKRVLVVDTASQAVVEVNLESKENRSAQCPCSPTSLIRMTSSGIFRLNELSSGPLWLVEIQDSGLRTVFVPPDPSAPELEE